MKHSWGNFAVVWVFEESANFAESQISVRSVQRRCMEAVQRKPYRL